MNKQTKHLRKQHISSKVGKGINLMEDGAEKSGALTFHKFVSSNGRAVNSSAERAASGKKPFRGAIAQRPKSLGEPVAE